MWGLCSIFPDLFLRRIFPYPYAWLLPLFSTLYDATFSLSLSSFLGDGGKILSVAIVSNVVLLLIKDLEAFDALHHRMCE